MNALVVKMQQRRPERAPMFADRLELLDAAVELLDALRMIALARAVGEARNARQELPGHVKDKLADHDYVMTELRLKVANGTPATADYVFAKDLLDSVGGAS